MQMNKNTPEDWVQECVGSQLKDMFSIGIVIPLPRYITTY